jgi:hypothetical protein
MRGITLHLEELIEERERERERRRAPKAMALAMLMALAGFLAGRDTTPRPEPAPELRVVVKAAGLAWPAFEPVAIERTKRPAAAPRPAGERTDLLTATRGLTQLFGPDAAALPPHLCVSPKAVLFPRGGRQAVERVTISNPGASGVLITGIALRGDGARSAVTVETGGCAQTILSPGEHCTLTVTLRERTGLPAELWIDNDSGEPVAVTVM